MKIMMEEALFFIALHINNWFVGTNFDYVIKELKVMIA